MNRLKERTTFNTLKMLVRYDAENGRIFWLVDRSRTAKAGNEIGTKNKTHRIFKFHGQVYQTHRFIYWLETGVLPEVVTHSVTTLNARGEVDNHFSNLKQMSSDSLFKQVISYDE